MSFSLTQDIDIVGIGYCGLDTLCVVPRIPIDDKVPIRRMLIQGGGPAATATVAAARLGLRTAFAGVVGDDDRGAAIRREFEAEGVDTRHLLSRPGAESAAAFCWIEETSGRRSIAWTHGSAPALRAAEVNAELIRRARALHFDGHHPQAAIRAAEIARADGGAVFLDAGTAVPGIEALIARCTVVIASERFARTFLGEADPEAAVRRLAGLGPQWTGVTLGEAGSLGWDGQRLCRIQGIPVEVVDTTGAGDVYHGAFAARYVECIKAGRPPDLRECMRFAGVAAGLKCRQLGGRTGIPTHAEVDRFPGGAPANPCQEGSHR